MMPRSLPDPSVFSETENQFRAIAALATAPGQGGVAVIRISGAGALCAADALCGSAAPEKRPSQLSANSFRLYKLRDPRDGTFLDEALILVFRAPHSYTGEDVAEVQLHGGRAVVARVLSVLYALGVTPAEPGEFTRRAFLNGRKSLEEAEAVAELISARSDRAARAAAELLSGVLGNHVNAAYDELLALCADLEATLDFSDEDIDGLIPPQQVSERIARICSQLDALADRFREGRLLREGALVVLSGPANVGKSTLFNALLGLERSIVADLPGTTRDSIEEGLILGGVPLRLVDTAGLRATDSSIESEGIRRAVDLAAQADLVLLLQDAREYGKEQPELSGFPIAASVPKLRIWTKTDLFPAAEKRAEGVDMQLWISAKTGEGLSALRSKILEVLGLSADAQANPGTLVTERHATLLRRASSELERADALYADAAEDAAVMVSSHLRAAALSLGEITGRNYSEELLDNVFGRFCVGK